jgi:hypothetical protein
MRPLLKAVSALAVGGALVMGACNFDITDPNAPTEIGDGANPARVAAAVDGLIIAARTDMAGGWVLKSAILGREGYRLDVADPRFVTELIQGPLDGSNNAFGGGAWQFEYQAIRAGYNILNVIGTALLSDAEKEGVRGFTQTIQAYEYMIVLFAHTQDSIPIDVNRPLTDPPAPFVTNDVAWQHVVSLLDSAKTHLLAAGGSFGFPLPAGFADFNTPATFLMVNRALLARADMYRAGVFACATCYDDVLTALSESFVDTLASLDLGAYFDYSTNAGDAPNALFQSVSSAIQVVHPSIRDSVATKPGGGLDDRYVAKVVDRGGQVCGSQHCSDLSWIRYPSPSSPIPIIRNEELILLRAEANNSRTARNAAAAAADINFIRVHSGGLAPDATLAAATQQQVEDEILVQRKYSLLYEGHRWVDMRRTGRLNQIILDDPAMDHVFATLPINTFEVDARR